MGSRDPAPDRGPADWQRDRPPASVLIMVRFGEEHGVAEHYLLRGTRLTASALADPASVVSAYDEMAVARNLCDALPRHPALGLGVGRRYHVTTHGIWGFALVSSRTGWEALDLGMRFVGLSWAFCRITSVHGAGVARIVLDSTAVPADLREFFVQREMASTVTVAREVAGDLARGVAVRTWLQQPTPAADADAFTELFGQPPVFGADVNALEIDAALLDAALPLADSHAAALAIEQCRDLLDRSHQRSGVAGEVRRLLTARPHELPDLEQVAAALHLSSRTLRRRLTAEGTSFRALLDDVRERLAEELLTTGLTVEQVAHRLGYAATPAFTTAFRRWKGIVPSQYPGRPATPRP